MEMDYLSVLESPKANKFKEESEEEAFSKIFSFEMGQRENFDEIDMNKIYYINHKAQNKSENIKKEEHINEILLFDDFETAFNRLECNEEEEKNNASYFKIESYEKEDYCFPSFVKRVVKESKCTIKDDDKEIIINVEVPNKKPKKIENCFKFNQLKNNLKHKEKSINENENKNTEKKKRGPYKKKERAVEQINTDDSCFPFTNGKGLFNANNPVVQFIQTPSTMEPFSLSEQDYDMDDKNKKMAIYEGKKEEESYNTNEENNNNMNLKFTTRKYYIDSNGKKKRTKKKRKFKPDDIRKKIKARFHKIIKNIINENLKKAGSNELFDFLPQCFIGNVSKKINSYSLDLTYKEILSTDYNKELNAKSNIDNIKYLKNLKVLNYLEEHPEIMERSGFDIVQNKKYKDLLSTYFSSAQFENSITQLRAENESNDYIQEYTYRAKTYLSFYSKKENVEK